ncbi:unnamed protein product [Ectocarpus sp. 6 AP-2014]
MEGLETAVMPEIEVPVERLPREPPERRPFDLDAAVFLADFAFEAYREPGKVAWEVPGPSSVRFKEGAFVSKVFPGLLTVSLLAAEGLPIVLEPVGGDAGKREREINPSVSMVLADEDMRSGTLTSVKRPLPGGRCWGELFSMHVHDPGTSVLEVGLWDKGEEGAIPLSVTGVFRGDGGKELVGTARVPLCKLLKGMSKGRDDAWTGWVEIDPIAPDDEDEDDVIKTNADADRVGGSDRPLAAARLHLDIRFAPMERYQGDDLPTAPRASEEDVGGVGTLAGSMRARWQNLVGQDDTAAAGGSEDTAAAAAAATADGEGVEVYAPGLSANRTFLYKEDEEGGGVMAGRMDGGNSGGPGGGVGDNLSSARRSKGSSASGGSGRSSGPIEGEGGGFWKWGREAGGDKAKRAGGGGGGGGSEGKAKVKRKRTPVVLREDGMPDWSVLTNRVDGLAEQAGSFELMCFIDNHDTDTQASQGRGSRLFFWVGVWRDEAKKRLVVSFRGTAQLEDVITDEDLDHSGVTQRAVLPAVDDVMAAVRETTAGWKKERVQPIPVTLAQQKVHMLESMNKLLDTSRELLKDLQDTTTASAAGGGVQQLSGDKSGDTAPDGGGVESGGSAVGARPADEILSAVTGLLRLGGPAEPASADEGGVLTTTATAAGTTAAAAATSVGGGEEEERKVGGTAAAAAAAAATNLINLLDSSNDATGGGGGAAAAANTAASSDGEGDGVGRRVVGKLWKRWKGEGQEAGGAGGEISKGPKAPGLSGERGLSDTLAWVQQVAEQKMDEMASSQTFIGEETRRQMQLLSEGKVNATESREILAGFFREQLEKVEATRELVDRVEEFRESLGEVGVEWDGDAGGLVGLDGLNNRGAGV